MSRLDLFVVLGLFCALPAHAAGRLPSRALDAVPLHVVAADAVEQARARQPPDPGTHAPLRLSVGVPMDVSLADGTWSTDPATGQALWHARVYSAGATLLIPGFDRFDIPDGAELRVADAAGRVVQGPYTRREHGSSGRLQTAMVPGQELLIELRVPTAKRDAVDLHLASIGHGVHDFSGVVPKSGSCNIDVACPQGDDWRDQIRSVVRLQIPVEGNAGFYVLCTGQLINNTAGATNRYFLLTANHCGATAATASDVTAYFSFQTASCNGTRTEDPAGFPNKTGTTFRASHERGDHTLLEFNSAPASSLDVFYSGFDAGTGTSVSSGASIHHPSGHEKRISLFTGSQRVSGQAVGGFVVDAFRVDWDAGVTEQGSSGAGLWNQAGRVVGVLSGGASSCLLPKADDYFGRLDVAWANLGPFLDTAGNGARSVGGRNGSGVPPTNSGGGGGGADSGDDGGGGGGGSFGPIATLLMLLAAGLRRAAPKLTSRRASRGAGAA